MKGVTFYLLIVLFTVSTHAQIEKPRPEVPTTHTRNQTLLSPTEMTSASIFDHNHLAWNQILTQYVTSNGAISTFNYKGLKTEGASLINYLNELSLVTHKEFNKWTQNQQMAFLINAYNAFTVKLILDHYPVKSIKDIGSFIKSSWKIKFFTLLEEKRHLDWIEHEVLRKNYNEPRIHFAVNCASEGCPALRSEAYTAQNLETQLTEQTQKFLRDTTRNFIKENTLYISKIFDWFKEDFKKNGNTLEGFLAKYISDEQALKEKIINGKFKMKYNPYSWKLNE